MIPNVVSKVLEGLEQTQGDNFESAEGPVEVTRDEVITAERVRVLLLHDVLGRVQVIVPVNSMLDVDALNSHTGRSFKSLSPTDLDALRTQFSLVEFPPIPTITGFPTLVDQKVFTLPYVYLDSGLPDSFIKIGAKPFRLLLGDVAEGSFAVSMDNISINRDQTSEDLKQINEAIQKFTYLRIKQRLEDTLEIPPLPQTAQRIIHLRVDPEAGVNDLADIVEADPSLSAQVVSWASSSFYSAPGKIKSVHDAIIRVLGFDLVMNLSMGLALGKTLQLPKDRPEGFTPYWQQSIWLASATSALINAIPRDRRPGFGLAYLSGLLHNFGYMVLAHVFPPHFSLICRYIEANPHIDTAYIEHFLLGITREQVGSKLMAVWNMPDEVIVALRHQKNPDYVGPNFEFANLLFVARNLLIENGLPLGPSVKIPDVMYTRLGLDEEKARESMAGLVENRDEVLEMAGMMES
jgi:HD-like signal output (HDOD) protein/prolyl-tRNA editing enzyme YbaK/EbsC (Cys-tRNA(Pro) deacylase)